MRVVSDGESIVAVAIDFLHGTGHELGTLLVITVWLTAGDCDIIECDMPSNTRGDCFVSAPGLRCVLCFDGI